MLAEEGVSRIAGAHCYAFFAGEAEFEAMMAEEPGTFFLTDFLARHFDRLVIEGLGLDRFPQLRDDYFGHYRRLVFLAQSDDAELTAKAEAAARRLGLALRAALRPASAASRGFVETARAPARGGFMANLIVLYWRDIPSQVIVKAGRASAKRELSERFIRAIDAAAMHAACERRRRLSRGLAAQRTDPLRRRSRGRGERGRRSASRPNTTRIASPLLAKHDGREA